MLSLPVESSPRATTCQINYSRYWGAQSGLSAHSQFRASRVTLYVYVLVGRFVEGEERVEVRTWVVWRPLYAKPQTYPVVHINQLDAYAAPANPAPASAFKLKPGNGHARARGLASLIPTSFSATLRSPVHVPSLRASSVRLIGVFGMRCRS